MNQIPVTDLTQSIVDLLTEAYVGPTDAKSPTWFVDNDPSAGIFGQINGVNASEASISADHTGNPGTTVVSHVEHLRWSLANANGAMGGKPYQSNWSESWKTTDLQEKDWVDLKHHLRAEFSALCATILKQEQLDGPYLNGLLALIPHAAYHLATIRQILERVRESE